MVRRLALPVRGLGRELGAGRVHDLARGLEHGRHRRLGPPLDLQIRDLRRSERAMARSRRTWPRPDRRAHPQRPPFAFAGEQPGRALRSRAGVLVDELADQGIDDDRMAAVRQMSAAFQHDQAPAGQLGQPPTPRERLALVFGAVDDEHRAVAGPGTARPPRPRRPGAAGRGCARPASGVGLQRPADQVVEDLGRVRLGQKFAGVVVGPPGEVAAPALMVYRVQRGSGGRQRMNARRDGDHAAHTVRLLGGQQQ